MPSLPTGTVTFLLTRIEGPRYHFNLANRAICEPVGDGEDLVSFFTAVLRGDRKYPGTTRLRAQREAIEKKVKTMLPPTEPLNPEEDGVS